MGLALAQARTAEERGEVPVGAVLVNPDGQVVAAAHNLVRTNRDPTAHAEMLAIREVANRIGYRLLGYTLVVTLEPCPMCAGAASLARLDRVVYGAADPKAGACWSLYNIPQDQRLNHFCQLKAGVRAQECVDLLTGFFARLRSP